MRIATFNLENLFGRPAALNQERAEDGKPYLDAYAEIDRLLAQPVYSDSDRDRIAVLVHDLGLDNRYRKSHWAVLREKAGGHPLFSVTKGKVVVKAKGRDDWDGWIALTTEVVPVTATKMTAKVIEKVRPDVLAVQEVEGCDILKTFNSGFLRPLHYAHVMALRGNDNRGIDLGVMTRDGFDIESIVTHVDEHYKPKGAKNEEPLFSRDATEYEVRAGTHKILVIVNHLKSQIGAQGDPKAHNRRKAQAQRLRELYDQRIREGHELIVVCGDFNDDPDSDALAPLLKQGSKLRDVTEHPKFRSDGNTATHKDGGKFDYILLSPKLFDKVTGGGIFRRGMPNAPDPFDEIHADTDAASDHAALFADIAI